MALLVGQLFEMPSALYPSRQMPPSPRPVHRSRPSIRRLPRQRELKFLSFGHERFMIDAGVAAIIGKLRTASLAVSFDEPFRPPGRSINGSLARTACQHARIAADIRRRVIRNVACKPGDTGAFEGLSVTVTGW
jgi:hypothetical protein